MDLTLEYRDDLTATFTCTAFGGSGVEIEFSWYIISRIFGTQQNGFNSTVETFNGDNSITSTATTDILPVWDIIWENFFEIICCVNFNVSDDEHCESANISIGKRCT